MRLRHVLHLIAFISLSALPAKTSAQITIDGSLGPAGSLIGPNYTISSSFGQTRGSNLFHSFGRFNVLTGESATFTGPNTISNILGRVTGGQPSNIDGRISSTIPGANLYLINPAGMLFGPNASLDVQGSFHVTTADYLKFADGAKFHADLNKQSVLTSAPVSAFGFLSQNPAGISVQAGSFNFFQAPTGSLVVPAGNAISLVGGDLNITGDFLATIFGFPTIAAYGGQINLASVASPGEVPVNVQTTNLATFSRLGQITLSNFAYLTAGNFNGGAVGTVVIRGGRLLVDSSTVAAENVGNVNGVGNGIDINIAGDAILTNQSLIATDSYAGGRAKDVQITAGTLQVDNLSEIRSVSNGSGDGGNVNVNVGSLTLTSGAQIHSRTFASGNTGTVQVTASDAITLDGDNTLITTGGQPGSTGNAGDIIVDAKNISVTGGAQIHSGTFGSGRVGEVSVTASDTINLQGSGLLPSGIFADSEAGASGNGGEIVVQAKNVMVTDGAQIFSGTSGSGVGGNLSVKATDQITLDGGAAISATSQQGSSGNAGDIVVEAKNVTVTGGSQIFGGTFGSGNGGTVSVKTADTLTLDGFGSQITASNEPGSTGTAGALFVEAKNVTVTGEAAISSDTFGSGKGGTVHVSASENVSLDNGKIIAQSEPGNTGDAGSLLVEAKNVIVAGGGQIATSTFGPGKGGTLQITASDTISLDGFKLDGQGIPVPTGIFSGANPGSTGNAGDLLIATKNLTMTGGAQIATGTFAGGDGGTMRITASDTISVDGRVVGNGFVAASGIFTSNQPGATGTAGDLVIDASNLSVTGGALIDSGTFGPGKGGNVQITATGMVNAGGGGRIVTATDTGSSGDAGNITLKAKDLALNGASFIDSSTSGSGKAGDVVIEVDNVTAKGGAQIASGTFGPGKGGTVRVTAGNSISLDGTGLNREGRTLASGIFANANPGSTNDAGDLVVQARNISVTGGAEINTVTFGSGRGGTINVAAGDKITLDGTVKIDGATLRSEISSSAAVGSRGNAGSVMVTANSVTMTNGAGISSETQGTGNGGTAQVTANETVDLAGGATISSRSTTQGLGGSIDLRARQINLNDQALISATSLGSGDAGNITIVATNSFRSANSSVTTAAETADGGNIHLTVGKLVDLLNSQITATVKSGFGSGGNITIDPTFVTLNHSRITANAFGGPGGNITIVSDVFLASPDSSVTASSALSTPGTVDIQSQITNLSGTLAPLPENVLQATSLLQQSCATRFGGGKLSSLVLGSRDGLPLEPGGFMPSPFYRIDSSPNPLALLDRIEVNKEGSTPALLSSAKPHFSLNWPCSK